MSNSQTTMIGNLTRDPELRYTTGGQAIASFGLAVNRRWQKNGEWQEETSFFNVVAWGELGENSAASLPKGSRVIVSGRLTQRSYETNDGEKKSIVEVVADEIGPSLRWAQCQIERTEREKTDVSAKGKTERAASSGGTSSAGGPIYSDEEPFVRDARIEDI